MCVCVCVCVCVRACVRVCVFPSDRIFASVSSVFGNRIMATSKVLFKLFRRLLASGAARRPVLETSDTLCILTAIISIIQFKSFSGKPRYKSSTIKRAMLKNCERQSVAKTRQDGGDVSTPGRLKSGTLERQRGVDTNYPTWSTTIKVTTHQHSEGMGERLRFA